MTVATKNGSKVVKGETEIVIGAQIVIPAPNFRIAQFKVIGTTPLVVHKFSQKAKNAIMATQQEGRKAASKKNREPKDFEEVYKGAFHVSSDGWYGFPAGGIRSAMIAACRATELKMTQGKIAVFVLQDGLDGDEGTPLVKIHGTPRKHTAPARNDNGSIDIRCRPMWEQWHMVLRVEYDADMLSLESVANLLSRAGRQVGIGEGRPFSKQSTGCGWGTFTIESREAK